MSQSSSNSKGDSQSRSWSSSESQSNQNVWGEQSPFLQSLYGKGQGQLDNMSDINAARSATNNFAGKMTDQLYNPALQSWQNSLNTQGNFLNQQMTGDPVNDPYLQENVQNALDGVSQNFKRNILPSLRTEAAHMGQFGGSRHGIAEGIAASDANQQALNVASQMYGDAYRQGTANQLQAAQLSQGLMNAGTQGAGALVNLGMAPGQAYAQSSQYAWNPLMNQAQLVGGPTVLTDSNSSSLSASRSNSSNASMGQSAGF